MRGTPPPAVVNPDDPPGDVSHPPYRSATTGSGSPVLVTLAVLTIVGTACAVGFYVIARTTTVTDGRPSGAVLEVADYNFAFEYPGPPWEKDPSPPPAARANLFALRRAEGGARAAFAASKFDNRNPQPGDLRESILDRLGRLFEDAQPAEEKGATWAGQPAVKYTFRGVEKGSGTTSAGEAFAIGYKGIGYWFVAWAPERDAAELLAEFADLRARFRLLDHRSGWVETAPPFAVFPGEALDYRIVDTERWWEQPPGLEPRDVDPKADLVLRAEYRFKKQLDVKPRAELATYILDPVGDDPVAAVRAYVRSRYDREAELFGPTKLTELTDEPQGDPPAHTEQEGIETVRLRADSERSSTRSKLHVLAAVTVGGKVVGVEARCPWSDRGLWERRLIHIAGSLRSGR
jgi:hypothetical protein